MSADPLALATRGLFSSLGQATRGLLEEELHPRASIRRHVTEALRHESAAEERVFASRLLPLEGEQLAAHGPVLLVYTRDDRVDGEQVSQAPPIFRNLLELSVEIVVTTELADLQDALDAVALAVQAVVLRDETQGGRAAETRLTSSLPTLSAEGALPLASLRIDFEVEYHTSAEDLVGGDPATLQAGWDVAQPDAQLEAEDEIALEGDS